ncbi:MAG: hypothetical protein AAFY59_00270 [Pseudomonadota bacterium]
MTMIAKPLLRLVFCAAALVALNLGAQALFEPIDANTEFGRSLSTRIEAIDRDGDVLFIGDSRAHQGLSPRIFEAAVRARTGEEVRAVNLARPGMQTPFFLYTLQNYVAVAERKPKVLIMNVSYYLLHGREWMDRIYFLSFRPTLRQTLDSVRSGLLNPAEAVMWNIRTRLPLLQMRRPFTHVLMDLWSSPPEEISEALDRHRRLEASLYEATTGGYSARGPAHIGPRTKQVGEIFNPGLADPLHLGYLRRLMAFADENDIEVVIFEYPWTEYQRSDHADATVAHYRRIVEAIAAPFANVHLVEHPHYWDHTHFVDPLHVNDKGAERLSRLAAEWYDKIGTRPAEDAARP